MKKLFVLLAIGLALSCESDSTPPVLPPVEAEPKPVAAPMPAPATTAAPIVVLGDGCDYMQYKSTLYCGHKYTHHTYQSYFLTHSGKCRNHEKKH